MVNIKLFFRDLAEQLEQLDGNKHLIFDDDDEDEAEKVETEGSWR